MQTTRATPEKRSGTIDSGPGPPLPEPTTAKKDTRRTTAKTAAAVYQPLRLLS
jgi:hypothetical protein